MKRRTTWALRGTDSRVGAKRLFRRAPCTWYPFFVIGYSSRTGMLTLELTLTVCVMSYALLNKTCGEFLDQGYGITRGDVMMVL